MKKMGKEGHVWAGDWITSSDFYVMEVIGSHRKDFGFRPNELESLWQTLPPLAPALPALSTQQPKSWLRDLHHPAPITSLTSPSGAPPCSLVAVLPFLDASSPAPASGPMSLPLSARSACPPDPHLPLPFTSFKSFSKCHFVKEISPGHTTLWKIAKLHSYPLANIPRPSPTRFIFLQSTYHLLINEHLSNLFIYCPSPPTWIYTSWGQGFSLVCSLLYPQRVERCLAHSRGSKNICCVN